MWGLEGWGLEGGDGYGDGGRESMVGTHGWRVSCD